MPYRLYSETIQHPNIRRTLITTNTKAMSRLFLLDRFFHGIWLGRDQGLDLCLFSSSFTSLSKFHSLCFSFNLWCCVFLLHFFRGMWLGRDHGLDLCLFSSFFASFSMFHSQCFSFNLWCCLLRLHFFYQYSYLL